ncbi:MAG: hypothetical protein ABI969_02890 [bacterium]
MQLALSARLGMLALASLALGAGDARERRPATRVQVVALDYALQAPDSVAAGVAEFEFDNRGAKEHELLIGLLRPAMGAAEIVAAHQRGLNFRTVPGVYLEGAMSGMLYAAPKTRSPATLSVPLTSGRDYLLLCQLRDTAGATPHALLGMFRVIHVR